jgi:integrase
MACIRYRRRRWVVDYRDGTGRRRWESYRTKREAEDALAAAVPASRERRFPLVHPNITLAEYAERWLGLCSALKPRTVKGYREKLDRHILPALGTLQVRRLHRGAIRTLLSEKLASDLSTDSVRLIHATLRALLSAAVEDDVMRSNPAAGLGRSLKLSRSSAERAERVRALDRDQLARFLEAAREKAPRLYALFFLMSRTGLRLGETLGLRWEDINLEKGELRVERALSPSGELGTPKSGHGRTVDLSKAAVAALRDLRARAAEVGLRQGRPAVPWLFPAEDQTRPTPHTTAEAAFKRAANAANLPDHFSPHCLRHTYASILLAEGVSPVYVQEQLGHSTIQLTVGTYGRWLRKKAPGALDTFEVELGRARPVAEKA